MKVELVYVGLLLSRIVNSFDIAINDEEIDNPGLIIKSKFKPYLPELQENLEIPVTSKQQSLKESFIPKKKFNYPHYGLRSRFRKDVSISSSSSSSTTTTPTSESTSDSDQDSDSDHEENVSLSSIPTSKASTTIHSRRSWIKDFLIFKEQKVTSQSTPRIKNPKVENRPLSTKITNYDDTMSDPRDLKRWVRIIADEGKDIPYTRYSSKYTHNNEIELDIDEFIKYLVEEQGFNITDLEFLRTKNLDYGLGEIESELNKLKEAKGSPKVISIGGEDENSSSSTTRFPPYFAIIIVCLFLC